MKNEIEIKTWTVFKGYFLYYIGSNLKMYNFENQPSMSHVNDLRKIYHSHRYQGEIIVKQILSKGPFNKVYIVSETII